jgi:hypothetical protein
MTKVVQEKKARKPPKNPLVMGNCTNGHGDNVPFYTTNTGRKNQCVDCTKQHASRSYAKNKVSNKSRALLPKTTMCAKHPNCTTWDKAGRACGDCTATRVLVGSAVDSDWKKGLVCTMTREYVSEQIGKSCTFCGYGPLLPINETNHPRKLSMNRIDNSKPHDDDPSQTVPTCLQCNVGLWILTYDKFFVFICGIVSGIFDIVDVNVVTALEDETMMQEKLRMKEIHTHTTKRGKKRDLKDIVPFSLTYDDAVSQLRAQHHCCSLCNLALSVADCTFDQTVAKQGYVAGKFTFMHRCCNSFKGEWGVETAQETARRVVAFKMQHQH